MIGIVTARGNADPSSRELFEAAEKRGGGAYVDPLEVTIDLRGGRCLFQRGGKPLPCEALIMRGLNRDGDIDVQFEVFEMLEAAGTTVLNSPQALSLAESKPKTLCLLHAAGLPVPRTVICQTRDDARAALREFREAVIKPPFGALGVGVERIAWPDQDDRLAQYLEEWRGILVQEYVATGGRDIRVFTVGGRVLGAVQRIAQGEEWRTNVHQGGVCRRYWLTPREEELALRAASLLGLEYTGVDLLPGPGGPVLLELNGAPQWHGLATATGLDVAGAVVDRALELARQERLTAV